MKADIQWTSAAFAQIEALPETLAFEVISRVDLLASFPEMGVSLRSKYPRLRNCRQLIIGSSRRIVYEFDEDAEIVYVLAVQNCRQKLPSARELKRRLDTEEL